MTGFVAEHRKVYGVEPICRVLQIGSTTYYFHTGQQTHPERRAQRWQRDRTLEVEIDRVWNENRQVYGVRKVWRQLLREGWLVVRCTVGRLMRGLGLRGVIRGKGGQTAVSDKEQPCPLDKVNRQFHTDRPNALWVSDFTYVSTHKGFVYVAFVIGVYARYIVGWEASRSMTVDFVLDALNQALHARQREQQNSLIHRSDRGVLYLSLRYSERLVEAGVEALVGGVVDSYEREACPWGVQRYGRDDQRALYDRSDSSSQLVQTVSGGTDHAGLWVCGFNHQRLLEPIGNIPPVEAEAACYRQQAGQAMVA